MLSVDAYGFSAESASLLFSKVHGQSFFHWVSTIIAITTFGYQVAKLSFSLLYHVLDMVLILLYFQIIKYFKHTIAVVFLSISLSICLGCSKEPSQCDGSFEYPQHMLLLKTKLIYNYTQLIWRPDDYILFTSDCSADIY